MFDGNKRHSLLANYKNKYLCNHYMYKDETFTRCASISHNSYPKISARSVWRKKSRLFNLSQYVLVSMNYNYSKLIEKKEE